MQTVEELKIEYFDEYMFDRIPSILEIAENYLSEAQKTTLIDLKDSEKIWRWLNKWFKLDLIDTIFRALGKAWTNDVYEALQYEDWELTSKIKTIKDIIDFIKKEKIDSIDDLLERLNELL